MTNNLSRVEMAQTQVNRYANVNDQTGVLDAAISARLQVLISTTSPIVLDVVTNSGRAVYLVLQPAGTPPAGPFTVQFPNVDRGLVYIFNNTAQTATLEISGQPTPPTVTAGNAGLFVVTAASGVQSVVAGGGGGSTFLALTDTPASYTGMGGRIVTVNLGETALQFSNILETPIRSFSGSIANPGLQIGESGCGFSLPTTGKPSFSIGGVEAFRVTSVGIANGAGFDPLFESHLRRTGGGNARNYVEGEGATQFTAWITGDNPSASNFISRKSRGTTAARTFPNQNDMVQRIAGQINSASNNSNITLVETIATSAVPGVGSYSGKWVLSIGNGLAQAAGLGTASEFLTFDHTDGIRYLQSTLYDINRIGRLISYTKATLPAVVQGEIWCSDEDGGAQILVGDTVAGIWKRNRDGKQSGTTPRGENIIIAASDETTALTTGTNKVKFRMPYAFTLTGVRASLSTAQASGSIFTVDINESNTSILSTKLTIDNTELTSTTAAAAAVISDTSLADDAEIEIDIDQIGDGTAKGLKVMLLGRQT